MTKRLGTGKRTGRKAAGAQGRGAPARRPTRSGPASVPGDRADETGPAQPQTDRLRYLDAATRRIARGMDLDETLSELCRAAVPAFADTALVHLYDPLPVGDETTPSPASCGCTPWSRLPRRPWTPRPRPCTRPWAVRWPHG